MNKFNTPQPGQVITVTTRYDSSLLNKDYDETTYENVTVLPPQSWTPSGAFCIPAEGEPFIKFRTIAIDKVVALEVHSGEIDPNSDVGTKVVPVQGSNDNVYSVVVTDGVAKSCDCKGFQYRGHCRHGRIATGEHPVNPRRETVKKKNRKAAAAKRKPRKAGAPTKADKVRELISKRKAAATNLKDRDVTNTVQEWAITDVVEKLGMTRSLAKTYVTNNWNKA